MNKKRIMIIVIALIIILAFVFKDNIIRTYVTVSHEKLEQYSSDFLDKKDNQSATYGLWDVRSNSEGNMVEFITSSFGLVPSSTYKGFYYSVDNTHKVFSFANASIVTMEIDGDTATWTDGTDNNGTSNRIIDNWFWFEASF